jgi:putative FmdB family regulatory protein
MPFYDYRCSKCGHEEKDVKRNMSENVSVYECPECKAEMHQVYSLFGFELKGTGWFKDGYSSPKGKKKDAKKEES